MSPIRTADGDELDGMDAVRHRVNELVATANGLITQLGALNAGDPVSEQIDLGTPAELRARLHDTAAYHAGLLDELEKVQAAAVSFGPAAEQEVIVERERLSDSLLKIRQALA